MNLNSYFDKAMSYTQFLNELGDNLELYTLHYNRFEIDPKYKETIEKLPPVNILVISEPWCGDSLAIIPVVYKMNECNKSWTFKVIRRDDNPELMDKFTRNNARSIPLFLFLNLQGELLFWWGPRPVSAQKIYDDHRQRIESGELEKSMVTKKIRNFYAKNRGQDTALELMSNIWEKI